MDPGKLYLNMSMSVYDPRHNNGIVLPKIFPNDTEISASFLGTNDFAEEERLETNGEDAEKKKKIYRKPSP